MDRIQIHMLIYTTIIWPSYTFLIVGCFLDQSARLCTSKCEEHNVCAVCDRLSILSSKDRLIDKNMCAVQALQILAWVGLGWELGVDRSELEDCSHFSRSDCRVVHQYMSMLCLIPCPSSLLCINPKPIKLRDCIK